VAKRATGFDMNILYHNRSRNVTAEERIGASYVSIEELLETSDFVVSLIPLSAETKGFFSKESFKKMKKSAIFINASRGAVVDGEIAAAGLDVFVKEPVDVNHPLLTLPNVVALPHIGSASIETREAMMALCCKNIELILSNKQPETLVNKEWGLSVK